jgi:hypothetical protein
MPNFIGSAIAWGQYFYLYQRFKELMRGRHTDRELGPWHHLAAGFSAGAVTATCTNPIWVVKTRMQTQMRGMEGNYRGLLRTWEPQQQQYCFTCPALLHHTADFERMRTQTGLWYCGERKACRDSTGAGCRDPPPRVALSACHRVVPVG